MDRPDAVRDREGDAVDALRAEVEVVVAEERNGLRKENRDLCRVLR